MKFQSLIFYLLAPIFKILICKEGCPVEYLLIILETVFLFTPKQ